jgi:hypothetical protein
MKPWCTIVTFDMRNSTYYADPGLKILLLLQFLSDYAVQLQCLQRAPRGRRVTEKSNFSTLIVGLAGTRDRTHAAVLPTAPSTTTPCFQCFLTLNLYCRVARLALFEFLKIRRVSKNAKAMYYEPTLKCLSPIYLQTRH